MLFFQILICAYVVFLIWDLFQIVTRARPAWNRKAVALALTLFLVPGMYKYSLYFPFVVYILVFTLLVQLLTRVLKKPFRLWMVVLCVAAAFSYTAYGYTHFQRRVEMDYALETDKKIAPTRLLFFSDLHYPNGMDGASLAQLVDSMARTDPDIVLIGGDLFDEQTSKADMEQGVASLRPLRERARVFYIYGNHDLQPKRRVKTYTQADFERALRQAGIEILNDESAVCGSITIVGRQDAALKTRLEAADLLDSLDPARFTVLVDHQPVDTKALLDSGKVDLMLSGHTHNGQLYPFGYLLDVYWNCDLRYGINDEGRMTAITSSGVNAWGFPARTMGTSEYVVVDIKPQSPSPAPENSTDRQS
ncbi:metallophosphoesterase [uncultured Dubosiella sp.]|uniref:metallophosphoesterase n=1 Tax=uncultured Dubosiella sp. TaxID=1937011 RepID=UPI0025983B15|nr:metallophosphoesterase [uncultured Dubosiella sp.]